MHISKCENNVVIVVFYCLFVVLGCLFIVLGVSICFSICQALDTC